MRLRALIAAVSLPLLGFGIGAVGISTVVAVRYAGVDRADNVVTIWMAAAACLGALATLGMMGICVVAARSAPKGLGLIALPTAIVGGLLWRVVPEPPKEALAMGLFVLFASPLLVVGGIAVAIPFGASWLDRRVTGTR